MTENEVRPQPRSELEQDVERLTRKVGWMLRRLAIGALHEAERKGGEVLREIQKNLREGL
jgi:hypothetical protein